MRGKKRLFSALCALALALLCWAGWNVATDPFGVFGDRLLGWDAYSQTQNPKVG